MASAGLMDVQKEATCPVCQELLTEPLSLGCGHHVCQACLTVNKDAVINPRGRSNCPVCGTRFSLETLQANRHLADVIERLGQVKLNPDIGKKRDLCVHHGEKLLLFCKEDKKVICWVCERSQEHRGHHTFLREEAVRECQENLQKALKRLRKEQEKVETLETDIEEDRLSWKDMSGILKWSQIWTLKKPKAVSKELKIVFQTPDLSGMLQKFRELTAVRAYWADFTFNPKNLNLNLILSEDHRQVTSVSIWPFKCCNNGILGSKCFSSGKHYWEVDVSEKNAWTLGVYTRKRTLKFDVRRCKSQPNGYHRYKPQNGYWVIGLQHGSRYSIFEDSSNRDPTVLNPFVATPLHRVGVFLDCEEGIVSFFNVTNHGSLIYKFSQCCFSQPAYPYFNPWDCPAPMTLCPLNS
ncbi:tripartite motif-containing protein 34A isoform X2 [Apodemus sylvaticus]|uniref:tripartite motif-containing protein 34A isoform X2 n=1 Tax=Apodemus sylvaticus TaxID=10129 RepID=UPI0022424B18|nr:tripartite motif-containing protein 34A isoform X2 [Apodemus sylvaticus]